jgi:hypothetical protein
LAYLIATFREMHPHCKKIPYGLGNTVSRPA